MKRFYKVVSTSPIPGGFSILLDGKPVKTKMGRVLSCPKQALADAVMMEWAAQVETIKPETMHLTQILSTKLDKTAHEREQMSGYILKYLDTDLLCYPAKEPEVLRQHQDKLWSPVRQWFEDQSGSRLQVTESLFSVKHDSTAHDFLRKSCEEMTDDVFTIFQIATAGCGSVILGLAFVSGVLNPEEVLHTCFVEENYKDSLYNSEKYGPDPMIEKKKIILSAELFAARRYLDLIKA